MTLDLPRKHDRQAAMDACAQAYTPEQQALCQAVLDNDHRKISALLDSVDHEELLPRSFLIPLMVLAISMGNRKSWSAWKEYGYDENLTVGKSAQQKTLGQLALGLCAIERLDELLQAGILSFSRSIEDGLSDPDPVKFDFWLGQWKNHHTRTQKLGRAAAIPQVISKISHQYAAQRMDAAVTGVSNLDCIELGRRAQAFHEVFLDVRYPASNEIERWTKICKTPPALSSNHTRSLEPLIEFQIRRTPGIMEAVVQPEVSNGNGRMWIKLMLDYRIPLKNMRVLMRGFIQSLGLVMEKADMTHDLLWKAMTRAMRHENPEAYGRLTKNMVSSRFSFREIVLDYASPRDLELFMEELDMRLCAPATGQKKLPVRI